MLVPDRRFELAESWDPLDTPPEAECARREAVFDAIPPDVRSLLDVGCGSGFITNPLAERVETVVGCDLSAEALRRVHGLKCLCNATELCMPHRSFDLVLSTELLEHVPQRFYQSVLAELQRVARKYLLVSVPCGESLGAGLARCPDCGSIFHAWGHVRAFRSSDLSTLFPGFDLLRLIRVGSAPRYPVSVGLVRHILGSYGQAPHMVCAVCGNTDFRTVGQTGVPSFLFRLFSFACRALPRRSRWLLAIYQRSA